VAWRAGRSWRSAAVVCIGAALWVLPGLGLPLAGPVPLASGFRRFHRLVTPPRRPGAARGLGRPGLVAAGRRHRAVWP